jgi:hypothetical protein
MAVVATWHEFAYDAAEIAAVAALLWPGITALGRGLPAPPGTPCFSIAFLATTRPDGSPRLRPFCPVLADGRLLAAIPRSSPKGNDLRRASPGVRSTLFPAPRTTSCRSGPAREKRGTTRACGRRHSRWSPAAAWAE